VAQRADLVVVHSEHVRRTVLAAGRDDAGIRVVPHGADAAMREDARPDPAIVAWKRDRPAVLFCGGLVWRKGFDVFLRAVLGARQAGLDFVVVVKAVGSDQHYGRHHLGALVDRFVATAGTPPLRVVDGELSRAAMAGVYTACDVLLHPYRGEGFGLPVLEARACGLPVIATEGGGADAMLAGPGAVRIPATRRSVELAGAHAGEPWVLEPSADACTRLLIATLRDAANRRREARAFAPSIRAAFHWDGAAAAVEAMAHDAMSGRGAAAGPDERIVKLPAVPAPLGARELAGRR
jgi:glycosyltransferase involved in cell wall biosynthesis